MSYLRTWLIVDVNYLCYRAYHSVGELTYEGEATGVLFGVMKTVQALSELHLTDYVMFCCDGPNNKRYHIYPEYKAGRKRDESYDLFRAQVDRLPDDLRNAGFPNVLQQEGYEADDLMAQFAADLGRSEEGILITEDQDLYQCLADNVWMYKPRKGNAYNIHTFLKEFDIPVRCWARVKSLAGCSSDNIKGVAGVGEKTAIKYLKGQLNRKSKKHKDIEAALNARVPQTNMKIVQLPIDDGITVKPVAEPHVPAHWEALAENMGMGSLSRRKKRGKKEGGFGL